MGAVVLEVEVDAAGEGREGGGFEEEEATMGGGAEARYSFVKAMRSESSSFKLRYSALVGSLARASLICKGKY